MGWVEKLLRWVGICKRTDIVSSPLPLHPVDCQGAPYTPALDRALAAIKDAVIKDALQEGGPSTAPTANIIVDCHDDPLFEKVLFTKGYKFGIMFHLAVQVDVVKTSAENTDLQQLRKQLGIAPPLEQAFNGSQTGT